MKYVKTKCYDCNTDIGFKLNNNILKRCRCCRTKYLQMNPPKGYLHKNREKFRKFTHSNVDYSDRIEEFTKSGCSRKKYRTSCRQCGQDRGYQRHIDALRVCKPCRDKNITKYTPEQKN